MGSKDLKHRSTKSKYHPANKMWSADSKLSDRTRVTHSNVKQLCFVHSSVCQFHFKPSASVLKSTIFKLLPLLGCLIKAVHGEPCPPPSKETVVVSETALPVQDMFSVDAKDIWTYGVNPTRLKTVMDNYFNFTRVDDNYIMQLQRTLDIEELNVKYGLKISTFSFTLQCREVTSSLQTKYVVYILMSQVNEYAPKFNVSTIEIYVNESTRFPVKTFSLQPWSSDEDTNLVTREIKEYEFPFSSSYNISNFFQINVEGFVTQVATIDYESLPEGGKLVQGKVVVTDQGGLQGNAEIIVRIEDVDDLPPVFVNPSCISTCRPPSYTANVDTETTGVISDIQPVPITAVDGDALGYNISYSIAQGPPGISQYIEIDSKTGAVSITQPLISRFKPQIVLSIEAKENEGIGRSARTTLILEFGSTGLLSNLAGSGTNLFRILAICMGVLAGLSFILAIVIVTCMRKYYRKPVYPDEAPEEVADIGIANRNTADRSEPEDRSLGNRPKKLQLSHEEPMKLDEEMATWLTLDQHKDIVDLSDEDTLRWKKQNGIPPNSTHLNSRDSAFEDSDKKSASEDSNKDHDSYPETEYAEVGTPTRDKIEAEQYTRLEQNIYSQDPTQQASKDATTTDSGVDEHEYLTPETARLKRLVVYNKAFRDNAEDSGSQDTAKVQSRDERQDNTQEDDISTILKNKADILENQGSGLKTSSKSDESHRKNDRHNSSKSKSLKSQAEEVEAPEYSTPKSNRASLVEHVELTALSAMEADNSKVSDGEEDRPAVPPRPKIKPMSGLIVRDVTDDSRNHYAKVNKKKKSKSSDVNINDEDKRRHTGEKNDSDTKPDGHPLQPPVRRKRPRKRSTTKQIQTPEEDVYDGTKDYADLEVDPSFYTDTNKTKIKRSSRIPVMKPDPNDTRYWITVTNDYL